MSATDCDPLDARLGFLAPTVAGMAARFAVRFGDRWRYDPAERRWHERAEGGWEPAPQRAVWDAIDRAIGLTAAEAAALPFDLDDIVHRRPLCAPRRRSTVLDLARPRLWGVTRDIEAAAREMLSWRFN